MGLLLLSSTQPRKPVMPHFLNFSLSSLTTMLERGENTSVQLVEQALAGFDQLNPLIVRGDDPPELHALCRKGGRATRKRGNRPHYGIPMTISLDTFDMNTTWGTEGRTAIDQDTTRSALRDSEEPEPFLWANQYARVDAVLSDRQFNFGRTSNLTTSNVIRGTTVALCRRRNTHRLRH